MSVENLKTFQEKLLKDESLQTKVKEKVAALETKPESEEIIVETILIPLASEENLSFSLANFETIKQERNATLSEEELEAISGGADEPMKGTIWDICIGVGIAEGECATNGECYGVGTGQMLCFIAGSGL